MIIVMVVRFEEYDVTAKEHGSEKDTQKETTTRTIQSKHQSYREAGARVSTTQGCGDAACQGCVEALSL